MVIKYWVRPFTRPEALHSLHRLQGHMEPSAVVAANHIDSGNFGEWFFSLMLKKDPDP